MCVEGRLQLLVGEVDQQLLERVGGERLEAKDVEDADEGALGAVARRRLRGELLVCEAHGPLEEGREECLREAVAHRGALWRVELHEDLLGLAGAAEGHRAAGEAALELHSR